MVNRWKPIFINVSPEDLRLPIRTTAAADSKVASQTFVARRWGKQLDAFFSDIDNLTNRHGRDILKDGTVTRLGMQPPDLVTAGLPCQPFTEFRNNKRSCPAHKHDKFALTFDRFIAYIRRVKPRGGIVEEVQDFDRELSATEFGPEWIGVIPRSWRRHFEKLLRDEGYAVIMVTLDNTIFIDVPRIRLPQKV